jgi:sulfur-oxidizing protein SoxY
MSDPIARASALARRRLLGTGVGLLAVALVRPAQATPEEMQAAVRELVGDAVPLPGKVKLEIPPLVENGNAVPVTVTVESPMTAADHVRRIALFNEKNPQPQVAVFHLGARAGRAQVATRMRLADSQTITALAEFSDGTWRSASAKVIVTLAACLEG